MKRKKENINIRDIKEKCFEPIQDIPAGYFVTKDNKIVQRKIVIGALLAELRDMNGYTQKEVALAIGVGQNTYSKYENGIIMPNIEMLIRLANIFQVSLDTITGRYFTNAESIEDTLTIYEIRKEEGGHIYSQEELEILKARTYQTIKNYAEELPGKKDTQS